VKPLKAEKERKEAQIDFKSTLLLLLLLACISNVLPCVYRIEIDEDGVRHNIFPYKKI
jgi:hypothetical protein